MRETSWTAGSILVVVATVLSSGLLAAQSTQPPKQDPKPAPPPNGAVSSVHVTRENVFDKAERDRWLARVTNGLHIVTKENVVAREAQFSTGQPFDSTEFAETARNLRKLDLFREVTVDSITTDSGLVARMTTRDSWSTQPYATFKSGGDQITWGVGIREKNLLGRGIKVGIKYTDDPDRTTTSTSISLPRVWRNRLDVSGSWDKLSDGERARFSAGAPFSALATPWSLMFDARYDDVGILRFFGGDSVPLDTVRHLAGVVTMRGGWSEHHTRHGYLRSGLAVRVRRDNYDFGGFRIAEEDRSLFTDLELSIEWSKTKFVEVRGYRNLALAEDVDLSETIRVGVWAAPSAWGYDRSGLGPTFTLHAGKRFKRAFAYTDLRGSGLFTNKGLDSGSVAGQATLAIRPAPRHAVVVNANAGMQDNAAPGEEFDLGLTFGPRGFPAHSFTGDRAFFTTAEYRWTVMPSVLGLFAVGVAAFADYGGAWYHRAPSRTGTDAGFGIRIGSLRGSAVKGATRIDLAHRWANDVLDAKWVLAIGSGFPFERIPVP